MTNNNLTITEKEARIIITALTILVNEPSMTTTKEDQQYLEKAGFLLTKLKGNYKIKVNGDDLE